MPVDKWRIAHNWRIGCYKRSELCRQRVKFMPCVQLSDRRVWVSWGGHVYAHERWGFGAERSPAVRITPAAAIGEDVTRFCVSDGIVAVATRRGCVQLGDGRLLAQPRGPDATCVDISHGRHLAAGWTDGLVQTWRLDAAQRVQMHTPGADAVLSCAWGEVGGALLAVGCAGRPRNSCEAAPLHVWDTTVGGSEPVWRCAARRAGVGVLACTWLGGHTVTAAGYDCAARVWDLRCGRAAQATWIEPHGDAVYSLAWDGRHALVGGAARHGRCTLWDLRRPRRYVQMYHTHRPTARSRSSPVYSVAVDAGELWAALDTCLALLDFAAPTSDTPVRNYDLPFLQIT